MNTIEKLTLLRETRQLIEEAEKPTRDEIAKLESVLGSNASLQALKTKVVGLEDDIKADVMAAGHTMSDGALQAVYKKGSTTWDSAALNEYGKDHPEVLDMRKTGKPSVSIQAVTAKNAEVKT